MELRICHLYPKMLNLNGDHGNVMILADRAKRRGISVQIRDLSFGERFFADEYDIVFLGNGQEEELAAVLKELLEHDAEALKAYVESGGVLLAVGGGYELLGETKTLLSGETVSGLSLLPIHAEIKEQRLIGNTVVEDGEHLYIGFENHAGRMDIGSLKPLGKVVYGVGNTDKKGEEGCRYKNVVGTYLHGPLLAKSPELADELIVTALSHRYGETALEPLSDSFEKAAKNQLLQRFFPETKERT